MTGALLLLAERSGGDGVRDRELEERGLAVALDVVVEREEAGVDPAPRTAGLRAGGPTKGQVERRLCRDRPVRPLKAEETVAGRPGQRQAEGPGADRPSQGHTHRQG